MTFVDYSFAVVRPVTSVQCPGLQSCLVTSTTIHRRSDTSALRLRLRLRLGLGRCESPLGRGRHGPPPLEHVVGLHFARRGRATERRRCAHGRRRRRRSFGRGLSGLGRGRRSSSWRRCRCSRRAKAAARAEEGLPRRRCGERRRGCPPQLGKIRLHVRRRAERSSRRSRRRPLQRREVGLDVGRRSVTPRCRPWPHLRLARQLLVQEVLHDVAVDALVRERLDAGLTVSAAGGARRTVMSTLVSLSSTSMGGEERASKSKSALDAPRPRIVSGVF